MNRISETPSMLPRNTSTGWEAYGVVTLTVSWRRNKAQVWNPLPPMIATGNAAPGILQARP
jgi:hypothetical protein